MQKVKTTGKIVKIILKKKYDDCVKETEIKSTAEQVEYRCSWILED